MRLFRGERRSKAHPYAWVQYVRVAYDVEDILTGILC